MRTVANLKWQSDRLLWEVMLPGMKLYAANRLFSVELARRTDVYGDIIDEKKIREEISEYLNDAFGGQEWEKYMWANPRMRKHLHLLMFAPDWTLSALNVAGVTHIDSLNKAKDEWDQLTSGSGCINQDCCSDGTTFNSKTKKCEPTTTTETFQNGGFPPNIAYVASPSPACPCVS